MRIAYVISSLMLGGGERLLVNLVNHLPEDHQVLVVVLKSGMPLLTQITNPGVRVVSLRAKSYFNPMLFVRLIRTLRGFEPDIVHAHMTLSSLLSRVAQPFLRDPVLINHYHGLSHWKGFTLRLTDRLTQGCVDRVICCSQASRRQRIESDGLDPALIEVMPNAIRVDDFTLQKDRSRAANILGLAGRLTPIKQVDLAIRLFGQLRSHGIPVLLKIAGDGPEHGPLRDLAAELDLTPYVEFLGNVEDMADFYAGIDVFLLSSRYEDLPLVLLEALAAGKFIVSNDVGGVRDILTGAPHALILDLDSEDAVDRIVRFIRDLPTGRVSRENRTHAARFDIREYARRMVLLYESLLR